MSDMNRRQFLSKLLPVLGAATVAPAVLIPERRVKRYWDMNLRGVKRLSVADFKDIKRESGSILEGVDRLELPRKIEGLSRVQDGR